MYGCALFLPPSTLTVSSVLQHCAQTLQDLNGGASCVQVYVNQHDFFISSVQHRTFDNDDPMSVRSSHRLCTHLPYSHRWTTLPDADAPAPKRESGLSDLFAEIRTTVGQEAQIVQAVFPNPALVMQVFLQRVFNQSVTESTVDVFFLSTDGVLFTDTTTPRTAPQSYLIFI